jgi:ADP-heptose:LPS heptosyltransferase
MKKEKIEFKKDCIYFNGAYPCEPYYTCDGCLKYLALQGNILFIQEGAMGDVLRHLFVLDKLLTKFNDSIFYIYSKQFNFELFEGIIEKYAPRVKFLDTSFESYLFLKNIKLKYIFNCDKQLSSCAIASELSANEKLGFCLDKNGIVDISNNESSFLYKLGLNDELKFKKNQIPLENYLAFAFKLISNIDEKLNYNKLFLTQKLINEIRNLKENKCENTINILINFGIGKRIPLKLFSEKVIIDYIKSLKNEGKIINFHFVSGGVFDDNELERQEKNLKQILERIKISCKTDTFIYKYKVFNNISDQFIFISKMDLVLSSDSFLMHLSVALNVETLSWFGPTPHGEVFNSNNLKKFKSSLPCSPCWSNECKEITKCNEDYLIAQYFKEKTINFIEKNL